MQKEFVGLGFDGWYKSVYGALTTDRREMYELWRWAWKYLERAGEEPTCHGLVHVILSSPADWRDREVQRLNEGYAPYEQDHRRYASSLAPGVRLGSLLALKRGLIDPLCR